ncbi:DUF3606 domain-containing protein [bacterium]|nr:DUF3606 domain-containing protein [bacterium]
MADDLKPERPVDPTQIHLSNPAELDYWAGELGVSPEKLNEAVRAVGEYTAKVRKVREWLKENG